MNREQKTYFLSLLLRGAGLCAFIASIHHLAWLISSVYQVVSLKVNTGLRSDEEYFLHAPYVFFQWADLNGDMTAALVTFPLYLLAGTLLIRKAGLWSEKLLRLDGLEPVSDEKE